MAIWLPQPYEDEILESLFFRHFRRTGVDSTKSFTSRFGLSYPGIGHFAAAEALERETFASLGMNGRQIVDSLTIFPFVTSFEPLPARGLLPQAFTGKNAKLFYARPRYCEDCFQEDRNFGRELYLRRSHQLFGSLFCSKHKAHLFQMNQGKDWLDVYCPENRRPAQDSLRCDLTEVQKENCIFVAKESHESLSSPFSYFLEPWASEWIQFGLEHKIIDAVVRDGDLQLLGNRFIEHFGLDFLRLLSIVYKTDLTIFWETSDIRWLQNRPRTRLHRLLERCFLESYNRTKRDEIRMYCPNNDAEHGRLFPLRHLWRQQAAYSSGRKKRFSGKRWLASCCCGLTFSFTSFDEGVYRGFKPLRRLRS